MWWVIVCPNCKAALESYREDPDGPPWAVPLHHHSETDERCPGSGETPDDYNEQE